MYIAKSALGVEVTHEYFRYVMQLKDALALEFEVALTRMYATSCRRELCYATVGAVRKALSSPREGRSVLLESLVLITIKMPNGQARSCVCGLLQLSQECLSLLANRDV